MKFSNRSQKNKIVKVVNQFQRKISLNSSKQLWKKSCKFHRSDADKYGEICQSVVGKFVCWSWEKIVKFGNRSHEKFLNFIDLSRENSHKKYRLIAGVDRCLKKQNSLEKGNFFRAIASHSQYSFGGISQFWVWLNLLKNM